MRNSIQVGDEVVTQGGIIGRVVSMKEDNIVIETGSERSKIALSAGRLPATRPFMTKRKRNFVFLLNRNIFSLIGCSIV